MSGILANEKCRDVLGPGTHATTFGANPVCAAAGLVVQETLTDAFLEDVRAKGTYLRNQIEALDLPASAPPGHGADDRHPGEGRLDQ